MEFYEPERVQKIATIMNKFREVARVGDRVHLGLEGDPQNTYRGTNRPTATIVKVKNEGTPHATVRLRFDSGKSVDIKPHSLERLWEFTDASFEKVIERNQPASYRGRATAPDLSEFRSQYAKLQKQVGELQETLIQEQDRNRKFGEAMVSTVRELTKEMKGEVADGEPRFSSTFNQVYDHSERASSPFDSDFSDGD